MSLVTPAYPDDCSYVRLVIDGTTEVAYWDYKEWEEDPQVVIGALVGTMVEEQLGDDEE